VASKVGDDADLVGSVEHAVSHKLPHSKWQTPLDQSGGILSRPRRARRCVRSQAIESARIQADGQAVQCMAESANLRPYTSQSRPRPSCSNVTVYVSSLSISYPKQKALDGARRTTGLTKSSITLTVKRSKGTLYLNARYGGNTISQDPVK